MPRLTVGARYARTRYKDSQNTPRQKNWRRSEDRRLSLRTVKDYSNSSSYERFQSIDKVIRNTDNLHVHAYEGTE